MGVSWQTGRVEYRRGLVVFFENDGIVWYDQENRIAREGWQRELEPFEGPGQVGAPFDDPKS